MFTRQIFVRGRYHGTIEEQGQRSATGGIVRVAVPMSYVLICPHCGDPWARLGIVGDLQEWLGMRAPCERHSESWTDCIPGSILGPFLPTLDQLPESLVQEEARLHLKYWENQNGKES